jgi:hypothetical protein
LAQAIDFSWAQALALVRRAYPILAVRSLVKAQLQKCYEGSTSHMQQPVHGQFNINTASSHPHTLHAGMTKLKNLFIQQHVTSNMRDMMSTGEVSIDRDREVLTSGTDVTINIGRLFFFDDDW